MMKGKKVAALENKRAELMAEIQIAGRRMAALLANLASVESAITAASAAPIARRSDQIARTILDVLRRAGTPLSEREIIERVAETRGLSSDEMIGRQVRAALSRRRDGLLAKDAGAAPVWRIVR